MRRLAVSLAALAITGAAAAAESESQRTDHIIREGLAEAVATSIVASAKCPGLGFNRSYARMKVEAWFGPSPKDDFSALTSKISSRFDQDPAKACEIAWRLYGPGARSGFTFLGLERPAYADPRKGLPGGFLKAWHSGP
jgi:hypothetical protein